MRGGVDMGMAVVKSARWVEMGMAVMTSARWGGDGYGGGEECEVGWRWVWRW